MGILKESFFLTGSDADILAAPSRLTSIPKNALMTIEASINLSNATNNGTLTLQLPNGDVPFEDLLIPANAFSVADAVLHADTELIVKLQVLQGGHVGLAYIETGATNAIIYVSIEF